MNLTELVPPPFEPVTLAQVYAQLRLDPDVSSSPAETSHPDDDLLRTHIQAAREYVEIATRRTMVLRTWRVSCGGWPLSCCVLSRWSRCRSHETVDRILLRRPPLQRVLQVSYYDGANQLQVLPETEWFVTDDQVPELRFSSGFGAPSLYARPDALRVDYQAGYTPAGSPPTTQEEYAATVPATLKQAVLVKVQLLYDNLSPQDRDATERMLEAMLQTLRIQHT